METKSENNEHDKEIYTHIHKIMSHTNYSYELAIKKLEEFNLDSLKVIKEYLNINTEENKKSKIIQPEYVNKEMFKQMRNKLKLQGDE